MDGATVRKRSRRPSRDRLIRAGRSGAAIAGTLLLAVVATAAAGSAGASTAATAQPAVTASVPGSPGTPQPPTVLYSENFEHGQGAVPVRLSGYTGSSGETYTADPAWLEDCNGWVAAFEDPPGSDPAVKAQVDDCAGGTPGPEAWDDVRILAQALGILNGSPNPDDNHAVSALTNGPAGGGNPGPDKVEFRTVRPLPLAVHGRFLTLSVNIAEKSCSVDRARTLLDFFLVSGTTARLLTSKPVGPCTDNAPLIAPGTWGGTFTGDTPLLTTVTSLGVRMVNEQGSGNGNDHAFDDVEVLDVTPQLDQSFSPVTVQAGATSALTLTITNTSDLLAKRGWSFTDTLPSGLTLATPTAAATTCSAGTVTAADGGTTFSVAGGALSAGQASCTVTVDVTSATAGVYSSKASNMTALTGVNAPGSASVVVTRGPAIDLVKSASPSWFSAAGQALTYRFLVVNASRVPLSAVTVTDAGPAGLSPAGCPHPMLDAGARESCTATYSTTRQDLLGRSVSDTATASGTPPDEPAITSHPSTVTVPAVLPRSVTLAASAIPESYSAPGELVAFRFLVTDASPVPMSHITVNDTARPGQTPVACPLATLLPGRSERCTAAYLTRAADLDAGRITSIATAQGDPPGSTAPIVSSPSAVTVPAVVKPAIKVVMTATPASFDKAGQAIDYGFRVTDTGNVTLARVRVMDLLPGVPTAHCPAATLAAGTSETCTATYRITSADLTAGQVTNRAFAAGVPPGARVPVLSRLAGATVRERTLPQVPVTG